MFILHFVEAQNAWYYNITNWNLSVSKENRLCKLQNLYKEKYHHILSAYVGQALF